jgi:hypothetical protein
MYYTAYGKLFQLFYPKEYKISLTFMRGYVIISKLNRGAVEHEVTAELQEYKGNSLSAAKGHHRRSEKLPLLFAGHAG